MSTYNPDKWVLLEMKFEDQVIRKILAGWSGGYLDSDSWKLSSGVVKTEEDGDYILYHNHSGSIYKCHKKAEGLTSLTAGKLNQWQDELKDEKNMNIETIQVGEE